VNTNVRRLMLTGFAVILVAPAAVFFFSAIGRTLQPTNHEPARTLDAIVTWFGALPAGALVAVLVLLPFIGLLLAASFVWRTWITDDGTRVDTLAFAHAAARIVRRLPFVIAILVLAFGVLYFAAITVHAIAG
jgi:hypothetical protein